MDTRAHSFPLCHNRNAPSASLDHETSPRVIELWSLNLTKTVKCHPSEATELNVKNYEMNQPGCGPSSPVLWQEVVYPRLLWLFLIRAHVWNLGGSQEVKHLGEPQTVLYADASQEGVMTGSIILIRVSFGHRSVSLFSFFVPQANYQCII